EHSRVLGPLAYDAVALGARLRLHTGRAIALPDTPAPDAGHHRGHQLPRYVRDRRRVARTDAGISTVGRLSRRTAVDLSRGPAEGVGVPRRGDRSGGAVRVLGDVAAAHVETCLETGVRSRDRRLRMGGDYNVDVEESASQHRRAHHGRRRSDPLSCDITCGAN